MEIVVAHRQGEWAVILLKEAVTLETCATQAEAEEKATALERAIASRITAHRTIIEATPSTRKQRLDAAEVAKRLQEAEID